MSTQTTDKDPPAGDEQTDAEKLAALQTENVRLKTELGQLQNMDTDRDTREQRLRDAEVANSKLIEQHSEAVKREAIRSAATTLGIDGDLAISLYGHKFKAKPEADGTISLSENPTEVLAKALREDPLLQRSQEREEQETADKAALRDPDAEAAKVLLALDRDPVAKVAYIKRDDGKAYMKLVQAERLARQAKQNA